MDMVNTFFTNLSERLRKENHLSDFTWALCCTTESFKQLFLEYCFEEKIDNIVIFEREYPRENCRPDFFLETTIGQEYIIEVKNYDRNDHFSEYTKVFPNAKKSFISNYPIQEKDNWKIKTWKDFIQKLEKGKDRFLENEIELINYYITYTKSVINFVEVKAMDLSNISSLKDFYNILQQVIEKSTLIQLNEWNQTKYATTPGEYGKYLWYESGKNKYVYFWIGLHFVDEAMYIYIKYKDKGHCPEREAKILKELKHGKYFDELIEDDLYIWIPLKNEYYSQLCKKIDVEKQKEIIKNFLEEVLKELI